MLFFSLPLFSIFSRFFSFFYIPRLLSPPSISLTLSVYFNLSRAVLLFIFSILPICKMGLQRMALSKWAKPKTQTKIQLHKFGVLDTHEYIHGNNRKTAKISFISIWNVNNISNAFRTGWLQRKITHGAYKNSSDDEGDEGTQPANINELFDYALELLWSLVTKNGWDQTKLPDISEGFSYVSIRHLIYLWVCVCECYPMHVGWEIASLERFF